MSKKKKTDQKSGKERIPWHPAFYAAAEFDLRENKTDLTFNREYHLSKESLRIDLLIIKKRKDAVIKNEMGHFFKGFNVVEYKSPDSALGFNHLIKTIGYACIFKAMEDKNNDVDLDDVTVSLFREGYPRKLMTCLADRGYHIRQTAPGIYLINDKSLLFPVQIVVTKDLKPETAPGIRILSKKLELNDLETFFKAAKNAKDPGDRNNISAILYASGYANQEIFKQAMEVVNMPEFFEELLKDRIEAKVAKSRAEGEARGEARAARRYEAQLNAANEEIRRLKTLLA